MNILLRELSMSFSFKTLHYSIVMIIFQPNPNIYTWSRIAMQPKNKQIYCPYLPILKLFCNTLRFV
jgi:hypothetical protein